MSANGTAGPAAAGAFAEDATSAATASRPTVRQARRGSAARAGGFATTIAPYDVDVRFSGSVARSRTGVCERLPRLWYELPVIARGVEGELEEPEGVVVPDLTVRPDCGEVSVGFPTRSHDELPNAARRIEPTARVLRRESFVLMVVANEDELRVRVVEVLPKRRERAVIADATRAVTGVVPECQGATVRAGCQVVLEPDLLGRPGAAAAHFGAAGVQSDQMPRPEVERVVPLRRIAGG